MISRTVTVQRFADVPLLGCLVFHFAIIVFRRYKRVDRGAATGKSHCARHALSVGSAPIVMKVFIDGKYHDEADAKVSVFDHGLLYGDGVFEGIRVYSGRIFRADAHLRRLYDSAKAIRLEIPLSPQQFRAAIEQTFKANNFTDCYVRAVVTRGVGYLGLNPNRCEKPSIIIITDTIELYPREMYEKGMAVITASGAAIASSIPKRRI